LNFDLKYYFTLIFALLFAKMNFGQNIVLKIQPTNQTRILNNYNFKTKFSSKTLALKEIDKLLKSLQNDGYLLAQVDSFHVDSLQITAIISEKNQFKTAYLKLGNLNQGLASKLGIYERTFQNKAFHYKEVANVFEKVLKYYENNGYPFASIKLDSVEIDGEVIKAKFDVQKNKLFKIDSILIKGSIKINKNFIQQYLSIKEGMFYNEQVIASISQKIKQLPFIEVKQEQRVQLTNKTNKLILFYDKKDASQFDGIIGFLPDATTRKTIVTGDVKLKIVNGVLKNGETFDVEWRRLKSQTQDFNGKLTYPFLFKTPFGIDYNLKIYRRDTTFIDINNNIGLQYYFRGLNFIKLFYKQRNNNLISTNGFEFISILPEFADIETKAYGLGLFFEQLDYRFNPKKGLSINLSGQAGNRRIKKNPKINDQAYSNLLLKSAQYQIEGHVALYYPIIKNNVIKLCFQGAGIFGNSSIYTNELFRIGGLKTLRGFDEESIFASTYVISTLEYRFLYSKNSNIFLFGEGAFYENLSNDNYKKDTPLALGAGINFETKAGILTLNYALGNQLGNGFDVRSGKIHFGLTALF
jgi:outer membrane protein assembly factor BamA